MSKTAAPSLMNRCRQPEGLWLVIFADSHLVLMMYLYSPRDKIIMKQNNQRVSAVIAVETKDKQIISGVK